MTTVLDTNQVFTEPSKTRLLDQLASLPPREMVKLIMHPRVMFSLPTTELQQMAGVIAQELSNRYQVELSAPDELPPDWMRIAQELQSRYKGGDQQAVEIFDDENLPVENPKIRIEFKKIRTKNSTKTRRYVYLRWADKSRSDLYLGLLLLEPGKIYQATKKDGSGETHYWSVVGYEPPTQEDTEKELPEYYAFLVMDSLAADTLESQKRRYFKFPECMSSQFSLKEWDLHELVIEEETAAPEEASSGDSVFAETLRRTAPPQESDALSVADFLRPKDSTIPSMAHVYELPPLSEDNFGVEVEQDRGNNSASRRIDLSKVQLKPADGETGENPVPTSVQSVPVHPNDAPKVARTFERLAIVSKAFPEDSPWQLIRSSRGMTLKDATGEIVLDYSQVNKAISSPQFPEVLYQWLYSLSYEAARSTKLNREESGYARTVFTKLRTIRASSTAQLIVALFELSNPYKGKRTY